MGYLIEISESKKEKLSEHIEKALHEMGKAMAICEQFGSMGERGGSYGNRYDGGDMGYRHDDEEMRMGMRGRMGYREMEDDDEDFGERRGRRRRDSMGRYR